MREIYYFISTKLFLVNFAKMLGVIALFLFIIFKGLTCYTNHGEWRTMGNYIGKKLAEAEKAADRQNFRMVVTDSIFVPGKPATTVLEQTPKSGAKVKEHRTVYVTIVKSKADQIPITKVTSFYGKPYELKKKELMQNFQIQSKIAGYRFDEGMPNHILAVIYRGDTIVNADAPREDVLVDKGDVLEFILSEKGGAAITIPDLTCKRFEEVKFLLEASELSIGEVKEQGTITNRNAAFIISQNPTGNGISTISSGQSINLTIAQKSPDCEEEEE